MLDWLSSTEAAPRGRAPRPKGVVALAIASLCVALYLAVGGALLAAGMIPFSWGAWWLGGMETAGPVAFWLGGALFAANAYGLLRLKNWARRLSMALAVAGIVMAVPAVSAAVILLQPSAILRQGAGVIGRALVLWYLFQQETRDAFLRG